MNDAIETIETLCDAIGQRADNLHAQIKELVKERNILRNALVDAEFALDGHEDVIDGPEGQQLPNAAMKALTVIRRALYGE